MGHRKECIRVGSGYQPGPEFGRDVSANKSPPKAVLRNIRASSILINVCHGTATDKRRTVCLIGNNRPEAVENVIRLECLGPYGDLDSQRSQPEKDNPSRLRPQPQPNYNSGAPIAKTNTLAIVGFVLAFVINIAGVIVSIVALNQIKQTGEKGRGLAIAGIIIGALSLIIGIISVIILFSAAAQSGVSTTY